MDFGEGRKLDLKKIFL